MYRRVSFLLYALMKVFAAFCVRRIAIQDVVTKPRCVVLLPAKMSNAQLALYVMMLVGCVFPYVMAACAAMGKRATPKRGFARLHFQEIPVQPMLSLCPMRVFLNACVAAGKRLCTRTEWEAACRGVSLWVYPYGNTRQPGVCNDARAVPPAVEYFGTSDSWIYSELDHPCLNQLPDSLDRSQANPGCVTPEGFYDLMGNLHEWISDPDGTFKGGFYVDTVMNGNGCLYTTTAHTFTYWDYSTGFRCCADR